MPYWYWRNLKSAWAVDEATTNRFDLPERGALSALAIQIREQNEADLVSYNDAYPVERTTHRIVGNGNYEIINAKAKHLQAMNFWDTGKTPEDCLTTIDTEYNNQFLYLPFGRYLGDPRYGLHLEKFAAGVQFEETNTFDTTYYEDALTKYTVYGLFRKDPEPGLFAGGFLRKRQIINKDAASEVQYAVKLPTLNKLRQIHMFGIPDCTAGVMQTTVFNVMYRFWLSIKSKEEYIIDNILSSEWARFIHDHYGRVADTQVRIKAYTGGGYYDTMIDEKRHSQIQQHYGAKAAFVAGDATTDQTRYQRCYFYDHSGAEDLNNYALMRTKGILFHGQIPLLLIDPKSDETEWLDTLADKDVYVEVTENSSVGNWFIVLDELQKTYPS